MTVKYSGFFGIILLSVSGFVFANSAWHGPYDVSTLEVGDSGVYFSRPDGLNAYPDPFNCGNPTWIFFANEQNLADRALSVGLAAQAAGRKVKFYVVGCHGAYPKASLIQMLP